MVSCIYIVLANVSKCLLITSVTTVHGLDKRNEYNFWHQRPAIYKYTCNIY